MIKSKVNPLMPEHTNLKGSALIISILCRQHLGQTFSSLEHNESLGPCAPRESWR